MAQKPRILFSPTHYMYDNEFYGSEISWAYNIADRIARTFPDSAVVVGKNMLSFKKPYPIFEATPRQSILNSSLIYAILFHLAIFRLTRSLIRKKRYSLLHHIGPFVIGRSINVAALFSPAKNIPFIIGPIQPPLEQNDSNRESNALPGRQHTDSFLGQIITPIAHPLARYFSTRTIQKADHIIVINERAKQLVIRQGVTPARITILPPGIDTDLYSPGEKIKSPCTQLLTVAYLTKRKKVDYILQACSLAQKQGTNFHLHIIGDGPERKFLQQLTNQLHIQNQVTFHGFIPHKEIYRWYKKADILLHASNHEGFNQVGLESLASGLALLSANTGGFDEYIHEGKNGHLLPFGFDPVIAAEYINTLSCNTEKLRSYQHYSRQLALSTYAWDSVIIPKYLEIYTTVTGHL